MPEDYLDLPVRELLARTAEASAAPSGGAAAATAVALAAGLTAMSAGLSRDHLPEASQLETRARELLAQAEPLAQRDAEAYAAVLTAQGRPSDDPARTEVLRAALSAAADVPLDIARLGVAVLEVAERLADRGNPRLRVDARTACLLARAAVRAAVLMIEANLADEDDPRRVRAAELLAAVDRSAAPGVD